MKKLHIFSFNQHWFHLGSMVENVLDREADFEEIHVNLFQQHLRTLPVDMHFRFPLSQFFRKSPEKIALKYLQSYRDIKYNIVNLQKQKMTFIDIPANIEDLKGLRLDNLQVGMAVASHLISLTRDSQPEIDLKRNQVLRCLQFYFEVKAWFDRQNYISKTDEIWVCNGRTFHERIIVELAKKNDIKVSFYEVGGEGQVPNRWILHDVSPHDRTLHQNEIISHTDLYKSSQKEIEEWFLAQEDPNKNQFASKRIDSKKMKAIARKPFIVYYSSSDDELAAISPEWNSPWGNQLSAVKSAMDVFAGQSKYNLVIRVHPNQGNKSKRDKKTWSELIPQKNCFIFRHSDSVDSYELMRKSAAVLTHGSTMGIEAAFRRKCQAYLSHTRYDQLIPAELLRDKVNLERWLHNLDPNGACSDDRQYNGAIMWANYILTAGSKWENITLGRRSGRVVGFLGGTSLRPRNPWIGLTRLYVSSYRALIENRLASFKWN